MVIALDYEARQLAAPLRLDVSAVEVTVTAADYELSASTFEIPSGQDVRGTATVSFTALTDPISEGDEALSLGLVPPVGIRVQLGRDLEITITDVPVSPCEGIELPGAPVVPGSWLGRPFRKTTLELRSLTDGGPVWLDWKEPYVHEGGSSVLDINIAAWRMAVDRGGVTHSLDLEWFEGARIHLVVRSLAGECPLVCSGAGCELLAP